MSDRIWHELQWLNKEDFDKLPDILGHPVYINSHEGILRVWPKAATEHVKFAVAYGV